MHEEFSDVSKSEQKIRQQPETPKFAERAGPISKNDQQEAATLGQRQERIAAIDAKREQELGDLNAARAQLGLPPVDTSVAIAALDRERTAHAAKAPEDGNADKSKTADARAPIPELDEESRIAPEIRYYFQEVLGPQKTQQTMDDMGPTYAAKIRALMDSGKLGELVWLFTLHDPYLKNANEIDDRWMEEMAKLKGPDLERAKGWGYRPGVHVAFQPGRPSQRYVEDTAMNAIERSRRAVEMGWPQKIDTDATHTYPL